MKNEFVLALNEVLEDKGLPREVILEAIEAAMVSAYRRAVNASSAQQVEAKLDAESGKVSIFAEKEVVETVQDSRTEASLQEAHRINADAQVGDMIVVESTPRDFGRVAAQTARQVIQQRIREAERDSQMTHYSSQLGEIVSGVVQAVSPQAITLGLDMRAEGIMPRNQMMPGERFRVHDRVRSVLLEVKESPRGPQIILSRSHRNFLRRLLENEVPEIYHGMVEIRSIAREPGQRSKVAVAALKPGVDPVGACVGLRGVRIQTIVRELNDEKIDVIEWNPDPALYIAKALSPARVSGVYLNDHGKGAKTATVVVPEDQLSLAIGRDGQNARLAAKLTAWRIDIKSLPEASTDALHKLKSDPEYAVLATHEADTVVQIENILAKKAEGRPITPEEYQVVTQFVDRVERGIIRQRVETFKENEQSLAVRAQIPAAAFEMPIKDLAISDKTYNLLTDAGYQNVGDLMLQLKLAPDAILSLPEVGARVMRELETILNTLEFPGAAPAETEPVAQPEEITPVAEAAISEPMAEMPQSEPEAEVQSVVEIEVAPAVEAPAAEMPVAETPEDVKVEAPTPAAETTQPEEEQPETLEALFALRPEAFDAAAVIATEEEDEDETTGGKKGKKGKKKKFVEVEYDPDLDITIAHKKRKRGDGWEETW
jgi:N utilization substance protein A